jgi:hypothetical protein
MLKSCLTATIGQTLRCYDQTRGGAGGIRRARLVFACLAENALSVLWTATKRTLRCIVFSGFA